MKNSYKARSLRCVLDGRVISLAELNGGVLGGKAIPFRCGYAVIRRRRGSLEQSLLLLLQKLMPKLSQRIAGATVEITSPADGTVTAVSEGSVTLRTGDGISVTAEIGEGLSFLCEVGQKVRCGEAICRAFHEELAANGLGGDVAVYFPQPQQITELHVYSGRRKSAHRTAFYRVSEGGK